MRVFLAAIMLFRFDGLDSMDNLIRTDYTSLSDLINAANGVVVPPRMTDDEVERVIRNRNLENLLKRGGNK